jgi:hypothetical protein
MATRSCTSCDKGAVSRDGSGAFAETGSERHPDHAAGEGPCYAAVKNDDRT